VERDGGVKHAALDKLKDIEIFKNCLKNINSLGNKPKKPIHRRLRGNSKQRHSNL
jgi:hypothetical protein